MVRGEGVRGHHLPRGIGQHTTHAAGDAAHKSPAAAGPLEPVDRAVLVPVSPSSLLPRHGDLGGPGLLPTWDSLGLQLGQVSAGERVGAGTGDPKRKPACFSLVCAADGAP